MLCVSLACRGAAFYRRIKSYMLSAMAAAFYMYMKVSIYSVGGRRDEINISGEMANVVRQHI